VPLFYRVKCVTNQFMPMPVRGQFVYLGSNSVGSTWTETMTVLSYAKPTTGGGMEFALVEGAGGGGMQLNLMRSTDTQVFRLDMNTLTDTLEFQRGAVGATWTNYNYEGKWTRKATLEAIETVTVPAGTFPGCYKFHKQALNSGDPQPDWYEWICPGIGMVKWLDYWVDASEHPPILHALQSVRTVSP
jgi:hypothetical protein